MVMGVPTDMGGRVQPWIRGCDLRGARAAPAQCPFIEGLLMPTWGGDGTCDFSKALSADSCGVACVSRYANRPGT